MAKSGEKNNNNNNNNNDDKSFENGPSSGSNNNRANSAGMTTNHNTPSSSMKNVQFREQQQQQMKERRLSQSQGLGLPPVMPASPGGPLHTSSSSSLTGVGAGVGAGVGVSGIAFDADAISHQAGGLAQGHGLAPGQGLGHGLGHGLGTGQGLGQGLGTTSSSQGLDRIDEDNDVDGTPLPPLTTTPTDNNTTALAIGNGPIDSANPPSLSLISRPSGLLARTTGGIGLYIFR